MAIEPGRYYGLERTLWLALKRASEGKGAERHATPERFEEQPLCRELRLSGLGFAVGQIRKKALEAVRLDPAAAQNELLDVIVYAAAAVIVLGERSSEGKGERS